MEGEVVRFEQRLPRTKFKALVVAVSLCGICAWPKIRVSAGVWKCLECKAIHVEA